MNRTSKVTTSIHSAVEGGGGEEIFFFLKGVDDDFCQLDPNHEPKTSTLKGKQCFSQSSPLCEVHNMLPVPFLGIFGTLLGP